jgi:soluble lytic murein transglycosylase-like protein
MTKKEPVKRIHRCRPLLVWGGAPSLVRAGRSVAVASATFFCVLAIALVSRPAAAAELAVLRNGFSIRHERHLVMGLTTRLYLDADDSSFTDVPTEEITSYEIVLSLPKTADSPAATAGFASVKPVPVNPRLPLSEVVASASAAYHLDPDLVNSVIHAESGFNARAVSPKGARGLMQLMPGTANQLGVADAFDPQANVTGGSRYLRELLERYNFDLVKALAAYNAGPKRVEQYRGVPPFRETHAYVARIVHEYNTKKIAQEKAAKLKRVSSSAPSQVPSKVPSKAPRKTANNIRRALEPAAIAVVAEVSR